MNTVFRFFIVYLVIFFALFSCSDTTQKKSAQPKTWSTIEQAARGQTVRLMMWQGDPYINAYIKQYVVPEVQKRHGIKLEAVSGQGSILVTMLMAEREAGKAMSNVDMVWINGETFYQLRQIKELYRFADSLPNAKYIDWSNPFIGRDFQQATDGYECPWGNVQMAIIYDSVRTPNPPQTRQQLVGWVKAHPGRFAFDNSFTGMTLLKSWLIDIATKKNALGKKALQGAFNQARYDSASGELWQYINAMKPYLWKQGRVFPASVAELHQLFANGEVDFTMSNNDGEVDIPFRLIKSSE